MNITKDPMRGGGLAGIIDPRGERIGSRASLDLRRTGTSRKIRKDISRRKQCNGRRELAIAQTG